MIFSENRYPLFGIMLYCIRTTTLSAAPLASITVSRTKPGPSGEKNTVRRSAAAASGTPLTSTVQRLGAAGDFRADRLGRLAGGGGELEPRAIRREHDA